ncbi:hypothetical protein HAX54_020142 [Datura stramonium]|uniref:Uncharacterized protein n=1 Tax=Datura stramonium TaxID=4076 RepID=A0ABS8UQN0_DATST|nr:hypothetical protein [Datura stramonium]
MELPNFVNKFVFRLRERIGYYFPSGATIVSPNSLGTTGLPLDESVTTTQLEEQLEEQLEVEERNPVVEAGRNDFDWSTLFMAFCLTAGVEIALLSIQGNGRSDNDDDDDGSLPLYFQLLSFFILLAFASLFVGRFIKCNYPVESQVLERAGILFATTAFYLAMTMSFSLFLKGCSWGIFLFSLLAIAICNRS